MKVGLLNPQFSGAGKFNPPAGYKWVNNQWIFSASQAHENNESTSQGASVLNHETNYHKKHENQK